MTTTADLLFELGCEELPAAGLTDLATALRDQLLARLDKAGIAHQAEASQALWTPRRLCVSVPGVALTQPDQALERRGPAVQAGLTEDGQPTRALEGFARSCGVEWSALERVNTDKGEWFVHRQIKPGANSAEVLPALLAEAVEALPLPKPMRWGSRDRGFLRPVHWVVALLGEQVLDLELFGHRAGRTSYGHRFHAPAAIELASAADFSAALLAAQVQVDPCARRVRIREAVVAAATQTGGSARIDPGLLDEVMNLTEWPSAIACTIPDEFMRLPDAVIVTTIETHQRFFPVVDGEGKLLPAFIGVANLDSLDPAQIRQGYERVVRPRLADAAFFFDQDLKTPLQNNLDDLERVTYQAQLGSLLDKTERVVGLARAIAQEAAADADAAAQAARLAKCDLMSLMVGEFPELQGAMGRTYALAQGQPAAVAQALDEVYAPRQAGAPIAASVLGRVLAIAERLDTLVGIFAVGMKPTGSKDPFALRRAALGLARTLIEGEIPLDLRDALALATANFGSFDPAALRARLADCWHQPPASAAAPARRPAGPVDPRTLVSDPAGHVLELYDFILDRTRAYYLDAGITADVFEAVAARRPHDLLDLDRRLKAVLAFKALSACQSLAAANKRISNLLRKAQESGEAVAPTSNPALFAYAAERALAGALSHAQSLTEPLFAEQRYVEGLTELAALQAPVDAYFDAVMVMAEDPAVRANRLGQLQQLQALFLRTADVSLLAG